MPQSFKLKLLLVLIISLGIVLRFWQIGGIPASLDWDEAAWGYNAYSLGIDGKDEFGIHLPYKYIESFGDFKPPLYAYLDVIPVKIFGLSEFSTRFPSAFFGSLTVLLTYFLTKEVFTKSKRKEQIALASSFFLAISPWHIMLSRAAFEANVSTFFIILGVLAFLKAVNSNKWFLLISAISFSLTIYTFNTARIFVPLFVLILAFFNRSKLLSMKKQTILSLALGLIMVLPIMPFLFSPQAKLRFTEVNIFTDPTIVKTANQEIKNENGLIFEKIIANRRIFYALDFVKHYFDNFNPNFLFINGDPNQRFSTQDMGELFIWDLPFLAIGLFLLFREKQGHYYILPFWILLGIIPAATARETPHALRIETILPTLQIIGAVGFIYIIDFIRARFTPKTSKILISFVVLVLGISALYYVHGYYSHYGRESAGQWQYGYKEAYSYLNSVEGSYDEIHFTQALGRPYIYYLFYNKISPSYFRNNSIVTRDVFGFVSVDRIGKYYFDTANSTPGKKAIYVQQSSLLPKNISVVKTFKLPDGYPILTAYVKN